MITRREFLISSAVALSLSARPDVGAAVAGAALPLFDAHCHLKSADLQRYPRIASPGAPSYGSSGASAVLPSARAGETPEVEQVIRWMDANQVEAAAAVQHRGTYGFDNHYILDCADRFPARFAPVVVLDAQDAATPAAVHDLVKTHGLAGVRLTGMATDDGQFPWLSSAAALNTWAAANDAGLAVDLMTTPPGRSPPAIAEFKRLAQRYPRVRLVLDHVAWPNPEGPSDYGLDALQRSLTEHGNIYYKFSTINLDFLRAAQVDAADMLQHVVQIYGADHVLWGSDIGNSAGTYAEMVNRMLAACSRLSDTQRRQVLHDTGRAVFVRGGHSGRA